MCYKIYKGCTHNAHHGRNKALLQKTCPVKVKCAEMLSNIDTTFTHEANLNGVQKLCSPMEVKCEIRMTLKSQKLSEIEMELGTKKLSLSNFSMNMHRINYRLIQSYTSSFLCGIVSDLPFLTIVIYLLSEMYPMNLLLIRLSGDVESNPGPESVINLNQLNSVNFINPLNATFQQRLANIGLQQIDVGGGGDCFFRSVSHQLYSDASFHAMIRNRGVQYMVEHPERFIEGNLYNSWSDYLNSMSRIGTWCNALIVQAVSDAFNISINIVESSETFAPYTGMHLINMLNNPLSITIGHIDEVHYVSTAPIVRPLTMPENYSHFTSSEEVSKITPSSDYFESKQQKRNLYMRNYRINLQKQKSVQNENTSSTKSFNEMQAKKVISVQSEIVVDKSKDNIIGKGKGRKLKEKCYNDKLIAKKSISQFKARYPERYKAMLEQSVRKYRAKNPQQYRKILEKSMLNYRVKNVQRYKEIRLKSKN